MGQELKGLFLYLFQRMVFGMAKTLLEETLQLIADSGISPPKIANETGLKVRWMNKLINGEFTDPGVNKIEAINSYLRRQSGKAA